MCTLAVFVYILMLYFTRVLYASLSLVDQTYTLDAIPSGKHGIYQSAIPNNYRTFAQPKNSAKLNFTSKIGTLNWTSSQTAKFGKHGENPVIDYKQHFPVHFSYHTLT